MMWLWILAFALLAAVLILSYLAYRKAFCTSPNEQNKPTAPPRYFSAVRLLIYTVQAELKRLLTGNSFRYLNKSLK
jgi:hypothetical protein